jgi:hypothetical protein
MEKGKGTGKAKLNIARRKEARHWHWQLALIPPPFTTPRFSLHRPADQPADQPASLPTRVSESRYSHSHSYSRHIQVQRRDYEAQDYFCIGLGEVIINYLSAWQNPIARKSHPIHPHLFHSYSSHLIPLNLPNTNTQTGRTGEDYLLPNPL